MLADRVAALAWYHTLDLGDGVVTPGEYDLRPILGRLPLPRSLAGMRCLDVGTHDGFWAFEMERRGASEVLAIDLDDPIQFDWPGVPPRPHAIFEAVAERKNAPFGVAHEALGSAVERRSLSVYALSEEVADGRFDLAVVSTLLLHLRDPMGALQAIRRVADRVLVNDVVSLSLCIHHPRRPAARLRGRPGEPFWWIPNAAALRQEVTAGGFAVEASGGPYLVPNGPGRTLPPLRDDVRKGGNPLESLVLRRGAPHAWVLGVAQR
jgi:tRNA (mo5U34)-methyltransferase